MWLLPILIIGLAAGLSIPLGRLMARMLDTSMPHNRIERLLQTGSMGWKGYALAMLSFNLIAFVIGFLVLALQPYLPLNPDNKGMLAPSTIFNTACSFLTNTNLQHYSGEVHLSYFSQIFFICWKQFVTPAIGLAVLLAITRGLRGDALMGNFFLDLWRGVIYVFLPLSLIVGMLLIIGGVPMTLDGNEKLTTLAGGEQSIARGPVAAIVAIKQLGTNGGGFFGVNSAHPFENPSAWTNILECLCIILIPMACVIMFGRMLKAGRHAAMIYTVMLVFLTIFTSWAIVTDSAKPNPAFTGNPLVQGESGPLYTVGLPIDQSTMGNLEGKELRFGKSAGPTWSAITTATSNGSVNCMHDSLNPLTGLTPLSGMWLNCIFGGVGVGLINLLVYLVMAVFLAGLMVGRTPEYLGKKVEAREMKLAMLALLIHPLMILAPTGLFAVMEWGPGATNNPGAHGLSEILYEFSSASANNGSGFEGLGDTYGFQDPDANASKPAPYSPYWDIATGLVMLICRFVPIIAPLALAGSLAAKRPTPFTAGTLRTDTITFGCVLFGTIVLIGALMFLPVAALGPIAEHLGPLPFGG